MDFTPVILVLLAIAWGVAGLHWLRSREVVPSMGAVGVARRRRPRTGSGLSLIHGTSPRSNVQALPGVSGGPAVRAGHSLTDPARQPLGGRGLGMGSVGISSEQARIRRRNVLMALAAAALVTLLGSFVIGGLLVLHLVIDAALLGFVLLLVQYQREIDLERTRRLPVYAPADHLAPTGTDGAPY